MNKLTNGFLLIGILCLLTGIIVMFNASHFTDKEFFLYISFGMFFSSIGLLIENYASKAYTSYQRAKKRKLIRSSYIMIGFSFITVILALCF